MLAKDSLITRLFFAASIMLFACFKCLGQSNLVEMISPSGDYIGQGQTLATTNVTDYQVSGRAGYLEVQFAGYTIEFDAPGTNDLAVGKYTNAVRYPFNDNLPGLTVSGNGRGCNTVAGSFEILELALDPQAGTVDRFWAKFSHSCEGFMPSLVGEVRFHSQMAPAVPETKTIRVPSDFSTIQAAIDSAGLFGDEVVVASGTYREGIEFKGKRVRVRSEQGAGSTILIAPAGKAAVTFTGGETEQSELNGFSLQDSDGGIYVAAASPTIVSNIILRCGYGIDCQFASPTIRANRILNSRTLSGGLEAGNGVYIGGASTPVIENNTIEGNKSGVSMFAAGHPLIRFNRIIANTSDGINMVNQSDADIAGNVIAENGGNGITWLVPSGARGPFVENNTIAFNGKTAGAGIAADGFDGGAEIVNNIIVGGQPALYVGSFTDPNPPVIRNNDVFGAAGNVYGGAVTDRTGENGNISVDPMFLDPDAGDYRLQAASPAIDQGAAPTLATTDLEGKPRSTDGDGVAPALPDLGAYEYQPGPPRPPTVISGVATADQVLLAWHPLDNASFYVVSRATTSGGPYTALATISGTNYVDRTAEAGLVYYYVLAGKNDLGVGENSAEFSIKAGNHPPFAVDDTVVTPEDTPLTFSVLGNDSDPDGDVLQFQVLTNALAGQLSVTSSNLTYRPPGDFSGTNQFQYVLQDGRGGASTGLVSIVVTPVNDRPFAFPGTTALLADTVANYVLGGGDVDSSNLVFLITVPPEHGLVSVDQRTGRANYIPAHGFTGTDQFRFVVSDNLTNSTEAVFRLTVQKPADFDLDGMADAWENLWDLNSPLADPDLDGFSNRDEYLANTSPRDPNSVLALDIRRNGDGSVTLVWKSVGGTRYRIYFSEQLDPLRPGAWVELPRPFSEEIDSNPYGTPSLQSYVDSRPGSARFYRIGVVQ